MAIRDRERTEKPREARPERKPEPVRRKPAPQRDAPRKNPRSQNAIVRYFQDTGDELRKVSWPSREQAIRLTLIVLGSTLVATILLGLLDEIFHLLAGLLV